MSIALATRPRSAGPQSSGAADRRRHVRAPVSLMGTVQGDDGEHPIVVLDLSAWLRSMMYWVAPTRTCCANNKICQACRDYQRRTA